MKENNKRFVLKERVRNTVELWVVEVDENGEVIRHVAEFMDYDSVNKYIDLMNKEETES